MNRQKHINLPIQERKWMWKKWNVFIGTSKTESDIKLIYFYLLIYLSLHLAFAATNGAVDYIIHRFIVLNWIVSLSWRSHQLLFLFILGKLCNNMSTTVLTS